MSHLRPKGTLILNLSFQSKTKPISFPESYIKINPRPLMKPYFFNTKYSLLFYKKEIENNYLVIFIRRFNFRIFIFVIFSLKKSRLTFPVVFLCVAFLQFNNYLKFQERISFLKKMKESSKLNHMFSRWFKRF